MGVLPGAEPFAADGGEVGVVLSHGFTGTPHHDAPAVFAGSLEFVRTHTATPAAG